MTAEVIAIVIILLVHVAGAVTLVWAMFDGESRPDWRGLWPRDDGDDGGGGNKPRDPGPTSPPQGGLSLPQDAVPSRVRLREPGRLGNVRDRPPRRPAHAPDRGPARVPGSR